MAKKKNRKKPKELYPVKDLTAANTALAEIAAIKRSITDAETRLNEQIDRAKAAAEVQVAPLKNRIKAIETGLLAFAEFSKDELFKKKRSCELDFGTLGYRKSTEVKTKTKVTLKMVLGKLKKMGFKEAIRTTEKVNKEELHAWPDERLDLVGMRRVPKDVFWYEIDEQKVAETAE